MSCLREKNNISNTMPAILKLMKSKAKQESQIGYFRIDQLVLKDWETIS